MKKTLIISGSNSDNSINEQLANYTQTLLSGLETELVTMKEIDAPFYSSTIEATTGIPESISKLLTKLENADGVIIISPEHNGLMPAILKNTMDWLSRATGKYLDGLTAALLSTSPGGMGGKNNLAIMSKSLPYTGADLVGTFSLGSFFENFDTEKQIITNTEEVQNLKSLVEKFNSNLNK